MTIEQLSDIYEQLYQSEGGQHLVNWIKKNTPEIRRAASKLQPTDAFGQLKFADGMDAILEAIETNKEAKNIGAR